MEKEKTADGKSSKQGEKVQLIDSELTKAIILNEGDHKFGNIRMKGDSKNSIKSDKKAPDEPKDEKGEEDKSTSEPVVSMNQSRADKVLIVSGANLKAGDIEMCD